MINGPVAAAHHQLYKDKIDVKRSGKYLHHPRDLTDPAAGPRRGKRQKAQEIAHAATEALDLYARLLTLLGHR
jgi:hypothetical protein